MSWRQQPIEALCSRVGSGGTPSTKRNEYYGGAIPWLRTQEVTFEPIWDTEIKITDAGLENSAAKWVPANSVIVAMYGASAGRVAISQIPLTTNQACCNLVPDPAKADYRFLYYALRHRYSQLEGLAKGAAQRNLNAGQIKSFEILVPPLSTQERVGATLAGYDDLIENNRRRIQLLEESARLLYKEWFVHLRFPGHEHVTVTDSVPEGWELGTYGDAFALLGGFAFKSKTYLPEGKFGIVTIKNVHDGRFVPECSARLESVPEKTKTHCLLETGNVLLSLTGNVGRACVVVGENYLLNQRVARVVPKPEIPRSFAYWTFSNPATQRELENLAYGVAQLNLSPVKLGQRPFLTPPKALLQLFDQTAEPIFQQLCTLNAQSQELARVRDLLLPRLMNGKVAV